jgi:hypothetical protein
MPWAEILKYGIPIATFIFGAALTLFLKRHDRRSAIVGTYARELSECANEWYGQIYELYVADQQGHKKDFKDKAAYYVRSRLVLPKYLRALEVLRKYPEAGTVVMIGERILADLTTTTQVEEDGVSGLLCEGAAFTQAARRRPNAKLDELVACLDRDVQAMNVAAGKLL